MCLPVSEKAGPAGVFADQAIQVSRLHGLQEGGDQGRREGTAEVRGEHDRPKSCRFPEITASEFLEEGEHRSDRVLRGEFHPLQNDNATET